MYLIAGITRCAQVGGACNNVGNCTEVVGNYSCECDDGYSGRDCEQGMHNLYGERGRGINCLYSY